MKRLSYVCEYWNEGKTVVPRMTPSLKNRTPKIRNSTAGQKNDKKQSQVKTNIENRDTSVQVKRKRGPASIPGAHNKDSNQLSRRYSLSQYHHYSYLS